MNFGIQTVETAKIRPLLNPPSVNAAFRFLASFHKRRSANLGQRTLTNGMR